jgi:O-methyltransferase
MAVRDAKLRRRSSLFVGRGIAEPPAPDSHEKASASMRPFKYAIRSTLHRLGYDLVKVGKAEATASGATVVSAGAASRRRGRYAPLAAELTQLRQELDLCRLLRDIHRQDAVEIEELYRAYLFNELPRRAGRGRDLSDLIGTTVSEAVYIVKYLHDSLRVPGDVCEFGVAQGATSKLLAAEIMSLSDRKLWLFDSFEGLPAPTKEDRLIDDIFKLGAMDKYQGMMASPESQVLDTLASIDFPRERVKIKRGWVRDAIKTADLPTQIAFAYVDFDFYEPIKDALEFIDRHMPPGGQIVVDDYGYFSEGAQLAVDRFIASADKRFIFNLPVSFAGHFCMLSKVA